MFKLRTFRSQWPCIRRYSSLNGLENLILDNIKATGPLTFATYMQMCLSFPKQGYYMREQPVLGSKGDFITSPEISQIFGELVGIWFVSQWLNAGKPSALRLIELGPGRGTLMSDILRMIRKFTPENTLKSLHLVETSPAMQALQLETLHGPQQLEWHATLGEVQKTPDVYSMLVAHEFFDVLPIRIIQKKEQGWHEIMVNSNPDSQSEAPRLSLALSSMPSLAANLLGNSSPRFREIPVGVQLEVSPDSFRLARMVGDLLAPTEDTSTGGCALIIDYGREAFASDSFRAFKDHKPISPFTSPGQCDITADVDFAYLRESLESVSGLHVPPTLTQSDFLLLMGLEERVNQLAEHAKTQERRDAIVSAAHRLIDPQGMGGQYSFMGVVTHGERKETWPFDYKRRR